MSEIKSDSFFRLVAGNCFLEKIFLKIVSKKEGGEQVSTTLRAFYRFKYKIDVDLYSYGCFKPEFNCGGKGVVVGRYCSIAPNVRFYGANHPQKNFSLSPYFYNKAFGFDVKDVERKELTIGNDVWIGYGVIITAGCTNIGDGAVIGAGTVVTHDVKPYTIVGGNPARVIKQRFSEDLVDKLLSSKWWEFSPSTLYTFDRPDDINAFLNWIADKRRDKCISEIRNERC